MTGGAVGGDDNTTSTVEGYWVDGNNMPASEILKVYIKDWEIKADGGGKDGAKGISTLRIEAGLKETNSGEQRREDDVQDGVVSNGVQEQRKSKDKEKKKKDKTKKKSALKKSKHEVHVEGDAMEVD